MISKVYSNKHLNISFTCPEGWTLFSHQQCNIKKMQQDIYQKYDEEMPKEIMQSLCVLNLVKYKADNPLIAEMKITISICKMDKPYLYNPDTDKHELLGDENLYVPVYLGDVWYLRWRVTDKLSSNHRIFKFNNDMFIHVEATNFSTRFNKELWAVNALVMNDIMDEIGERSFEKIKNKNN